MVYLTAVALARSALFVRHPGKIALFVIGVWGTWSLWGVIGHPNRGDWVGALLFAIFLVWLLIGRSPMVYLAAFFITTWLELIGTACRCLGMGRRVAWRLLEPEVVQSADRTVRAGIETIQVVIPEETLQAGWNIIIIELILTHLSAED